MFGLSSDRRTGWRGGEEESATADLSELAFVRAARIWHAETVADRSITAGTRTLVGHTRPVAGLTAAASLLAAVSSVLELVPFLMLYLAIVDAAEGASGPDLVRFGVIAAVAGVLQVVLWAAAMYVSHIAAYEHLHRLRVRLLDRLTRLPLGRVTGRHSGDLQRVVVDDVGKIELFVAHSFPEMVASLVAWIVITTWLLVVDPVLTVSVVVVVAVAFGILMLGARRSGSYLARTTQASGRLSRALVDVVDGLFTLAAFDRSRRPPARLAVAIDDVADANAEWLGRFAPYGTAYALLIASPALLLIPVGGSMLVAGRADADDVLLFLVIGLGYGAPIARLRRIWFQLNSISYSAGVIDELLAGEEQVDVELDTAVPADSSIVFEGVRFGYGAQPVIHGVDLTVPAGSLTALVGASGSGKSTMARLVGRFWDVDDGRILVGGVDVREMSIDRLLASVSFVFQDVFLFRDTVAANLRIGRPTASDDELRAAATAAHAHDFIVGLPDGYDTIVGTRGARLSGGERQRLAIARALLRDSPIVVMDEATAFVDPDSESVVRDSLRALSADRTVLVIAHRLTSVVDADQILVIDGGLVVERGTHGELIGADGSYAQMWADWQHLERTSP
jgi:ATP-binding cassette, subfamily B, bacterial IrtA/YbtP